MTTKKLTEDTKDTQTPTQQIVQHIMNREPSKMKSVLGKELGSRVMNLIDAQKPIVSSDLFGK